MYQSSEPLTLKNYKDIWQELLGFNYGENYKLEING